MKEELDYKAVPFNYIHCFNTDCSRGGSCLRRLVALHTPKSEPYVVTVNPAAYPTDAAYCPHFKTTSKIRLAWGMSTLFDKIPYKTAVSLRDKIRRLYPKTTYYRILHQERSLSPTEQATIGLLFTQNGVTAPPLFDRYTEEFDWSDHDK